MVICVVALLVAIGFVQAQKEIDVLEGKLTQLSIAQYYTTVAVGYVIEHHLKEAERLGRLTSAEADTLRAELEKAWLYQADFEVGLTR
jgi:hypothetical protein